MVYSVFSSSYTTLLAFVNPAFVVMASIIFTKIIEQGMERHLSGLEEIGFSIIFVSVVANASIGLMETAFAVFLVSLSLYFFLKDNMYGFIFLSMVVFLRLELVVLYALSLVYFAHRNRNTIKAILTISAIVASPLILFDLFYFQTVIPLPAIAKSKVYDLTSLEVVTSVTPSLAPGQWALLSKMLYLAILCAFTILMLAKHRKEVASMHPILMIYFFSGVLVLMAYILKETFVHEWYRPLYLLPFSIFSFALVAKTRSLLPRILLFALVTPFVFGLAQQLQWAATGEMSKSAARVNHYLDISKKLFRMYPEETLMTSEIGGIGYGFRGKIIDGMGLIQPDCLKYHPMAIPKERSSGGIGAIPTACVEEKLPGIIISYDVFVEHFSKQTIAGNKYKVYRLPPFKQEQLVIFKNPELWGSKHLNVYLRKDLDKGL